MKRKHFIKRLTRIVSMMCVAVIFTLVVCAYQADAVHGYDVFPDNTTDCHARLFIFTRSQNGDFDTGSAETQVSVRTPSIESIYVSYWYNEYNPAMSSPNNSHSDYAHAGDCYTPTFDVEVQAWNAVEFKGYHKVVYSINSEQRSVWEANTREYDDLNSNT